MAVSPALTGGEQTALAGASNLKRYLSVVPDVEVATAQINQTTFTYSLAQLTVDTTSADWSSVAEGMTVYVGTSAGAHDVGVYRVRKAGNSTTLYIGEVSSQDPGATPMDIRSASFANNQHITVVQRYDLFSVLPTINVSTAVIKEDYDLAASTYNTTPPPIVNVTVNGVRNHLATYITASTLALTLVASVTKWPTSSGSSLTYAWSYPVSWSGVSGSTSATLTATATPGNYVVELTVTDSIGGATKRVMIVNIHDASTNPPLLISEMPSSDTRDRTGRRMSFALYDNRMAELVDGGMVIYFEVPTWNGTDVPTATRQFIGWVNRRQRNGHDGLRDAVIDIIGPAGMLGLIYGTSQLMTSTASPSTWQEVVAALSFETFIVWYMLRWRVANILRLFNYTPFSVSATGQRLQSWKVDKGTVLQQIQNIATERTNFGANSEGELFYLRHPSMTAYGSRSTVVRDTVDASKYASVSISEDTIPHVSQVRGEGFSWDGSAALDTPYLCDAPKTPGQGGVMKTLPSQTITDLSELNQVTGDFYAYRNNRYPQVTWTVHKNRDVIEPAELPFVRLTIPANLSTDDIAWVKNVIPQSVSKRHNADGTADMEYSGEAETHGLAADYVPVPEVNDGIYTDPFDPTPFDPIPPSTIGTIVIPPSIAPVTPGATDPYVSPGRALIYNTSTQGYCAYSLTPSTLTCVSRSVPSWFTEVSMMVHDRGTSLSRGAYVLGNDGTDSRVAYTPDVYATAPTWTLGATVSGLFNTIVSVIDKPGEVYIFGGQSGWSHDVDFTIDEQGFTAASDSDYSPSTLAIHSGSGWEQAYSSGVTFTNNRFSQVRIDLALPFTSNLTAVSFTYASLNKGNNIEDGTNNPQGIILTNGSIRTDQNSLPAGTGSVSWAGSVSGVDTLTLFMDIGFRNDSVACTGTGIITGAHLEGTGPSPFASASTSSCYSTDFGATFGSPKTVGTVLGNPGFSVGVQGVSVIAGGNAKAVITNDHDGAGYRDANNGTATATYPIALLIPSWRIGSTSLSNKGINPNYFMAYAALYGGNSLVKVTGIGLSDISPSITGTKALCPTPLGIDSWKGKRVMYIGNVSGTRYMFRTSTTGASWANTAMTGAVSIRARRFSSNGSEWIAALGSSTLKYTSNFGTWVSKTVTGNAIYAEIFA